MILGVDTTIAERLLLAALLSGLIGLERTLRRKPAGLRTHILVAVGSALIMMISIEIGLLFPDANVDPSRIASNVVAGLGFLGAGTIIRSGSSVHGLTTAASLWATGAIGLGVGLGYYSAAAQATVAILVVLEVVNILERTVIRRFSKGVRGRGLFFD